MGGRGKRAGNQAAASGPEFKGELSPAQSKFFNALPNGEFEVTSYHANGPSSPGERLMFSTSTGGFEGHGNGGTQMFPRLAAAGAVIPTGQMKEYGSPGNNKLFSQRWRKASR